MDAIVGNQFSSYVLIFPYHKKRIVFSKQTIFNENNFLLIHILFSSITYFVFLNNILTPEFISILLLELTFNARVREGQE